jgi:Na+/H+-dicarboxylate symporter
VYNMQVSDEPQRGRIATILVDVFSNLSSAAMFAVVGVLFAVGAVGGLSLVGRLGGAGWIIYFVVICTYALVFGPVIAYAAKFRQKGSSRHRAELARRRGLQREKFGLDRLERARAERERAAAEDRP